jgi:hypothetical protein
VRLALIYSLRLSLHPVHVFPCTARFRDTIRRHLSRCRQHCSGLGACHLHPSSRLQSAIISVSTHRVTECCSVRRTWDAYVAAPEIRRDPSSNYCNLVWPLTLSPSSHPLRHTVAARSGTGAVRSCDPLWPDQTFFI